MTEYRFHEAHQAVNEFVRRLDAEISARVKSLIEDKHLCQSVTIDADIIKPGILEDVMRDHVRSIVEELTAVQKAKLTGLSSWVSQRVYCREYQLSKRTIATALFCRVHSPRP